MRISVGLPLYDGQMSYRLAGCLMTEIPIALGLGDNIAVRVLPGCTNLAMGRNQIVKEFLESEDDRLVFLDADVTFAPGELVKMAHFTEDFVGGAYRIKTESESYPIAYLEDRPELWANEHGLLELRMVPTGFLSLSRNVFARFKEAYPSREYESRGQQSFAYFEIPYLNGALYTEDAWFCRMWREMGGQIFLNPELSLTHWDGNIPYPGHIGKWLKNRITKGNENVST